ncbi:MAG: S8 family serine peptidase [Thermodesulfovibrionales bacterium]|jgi:subtilisin family serine protease
MKKLFYLVICLTLAACGSQKSADVSSGASTTTVSKSRVTLQSILSETDKGKYVHGELLVKFKSGTAKASAQKAHQAVGASVIRKSTLVQNVERVKLPQGLSVKDAIVRYMSNPDVEYASPNFIRKVASTEVMPNDDFFGDQWALRNTGQYAYGTAGADIEATQAWRVSTGNYDIVIAVLDTGVDYNHNDLSSNMWRNASECDGVSGVDDDHNGFVDDCKGWDFVTCEKWDDTGCVLPVTGDNDPMDEFGHGTHVAGIIGAVGNNQTGITGVMWRTHMMPVRILNQNGEGDDLDIAEGIKYAVNMGAKAINASWGGFGSTPVLQDAVEYANSHGVLFIAAAGNESNNNDLNPFYPASYPFGNIISVAATDQNDLRVPFSNFGYTSVDVAAPGTYIISTVPAWLDNGYSYLEQFSGTSMAAPHVTGLAGLLYSYYTNFNSAQIRNMILYYVDILPSLDGWIATRGRINAFRAMSSLWEPFDLTLNQVSAFQINFSWTDIATDELYYLVERKEEGGTFALLQTLGQNANSYIDGSNFKDGTKYYYRLRLKNWIGESPGHPDNVASIITVLNPPTDLTAIALSNARVSLTWVDNSNSESGFRIFRHGSDASFIQVGQVGPNVSTPRNISTFTDSGLNIATKYWYQVKAYNAVAGDSAPSNTVEVTTLTSSGHRSGGGGGGCSIGAKQNVPTSFADASVMLLPLLVIAVLRRRR